MRCHEVVSRILVLLVLCCLFSGCMELELREAVSKNDPNECQKLSADSRDDCYTEYAVDRKDAGLCEKAVYGKNYCYAQVARARKDADLCMKITGSSTSLNTCVANVASDTGDFTPCINHLSGTGKSACIKAVAVKLRDVSVCDYLEYGSGRNGCIESVAVAQHDASLCEKVNTEKGRIYCRGAVGGTAPPSDPAEGGFDPMDPDSGNGGTF